MSSPLHLSGNLNSYVSGEVTIDPSAAIAPGAILQATPNSRIAIAAGVCIGMGSVLHAHDGILEIGSGAILGAGVLVVGAGKIGENACIGSATTIFNCSIEPGQVVAPGSLIGDTSRSVDEPPAVNDTTTHEVEVVTESSTQPEPESQMIQPEPESTSTATPVIYGKASVTQLISKLLPYKQSLQPEQNGSSPPQNT